MEMLGVLAKVAEERTNEIADDSPLTVELVLRAATLFLHQHHALPEEQLRGLNFDLEEAARDVADLTNRIYHQKDRKALKANLPVFARAAEGTS